MPNQFNRKEFGSKLKELRIQRKWTQKELADKAGYSQNTISNWENGNREPDTIGDIVELANLFNVEVSYLVDNSEVNINNKDKNIYGDHIKNLEYFEGNPELLELYKDIYESESLQLLFDSAKDLSPEDLESVLIHIQGIRKARGLD